MSQLIFITGATGFIGSQTVNAALREGYRVRLSIRRQQQSEDIKRWIAGPSDLIETVHVPDLTNEDALASALHGADHVFHLASPMPGKGNNVREDYVDPAVTSTLALLRAASTHRSIKTVIVESSVLALIPLGGIAKPPVIVKANTNERLPVNLDMKFPSGFQGHGMKYTISKILAHQATRDFVVQQRPQYKLLTFHPVFVLGDSLVQKSTAGVDGMNAQFMHSLSQTSPTIPGAWVHVRDVADAHIRAVQESSRIETGTEFIISAPVSSWADAAELVRKQFKEVPCKLEPPFPEDWQIDTAGADDVLNMKWRPTEQIVRDIVRQQLSLRRLFSL